MADVNRSTEARMPSDNLPDAFEHPRGTLAIVIVFGLLFVVGWVAVYVFLFLQRGAPHS
jgi:Cytochrome c oxidase subunit IIa family